MNELGPGMKANVGSSGKRKHRSVTLSGEIFFFFEFFKKIQEKIYVAVSGCENFEFVQSK